MWITILDTYDNQRLGHTHVSSDIFRRNLDGSVVNTTAVVVTLDTPRENCRAKAHWQNDDRTDGEFIAVRGNVGKGASVYYAAGSLRLTGDTVDRLLGPAHVRGFQ